MSFVLEVSERAERAVDRRGEVAVGLAAAVGAHALPEERVVVVPAAVVAHRPLLVLREAVEVLEHLLDRLVRPVGALERGVGLVHVGLVVLVVVDAHRLLVDVRLERGVVVREIGNLVGHSEPSFAFGGCLESIAAEVLRRARRPSASDCSRGHHQALRRRVQRVAGYALVMFDPARPEPDGVDFERSVEDALDSLPPELRGFMSNVAIVVEEEPPAGTRLLGLYQGLPLTRRGSAYAGLPPDKITIYRGPLERLYGADPDRLRREIRRVVLHEVAHHFGISDERLLEIDRY